MLSSLFTGISGLNAHQTALGVVGDNIANVNTIGFKASRSSFEDILSQSLSGGSNMQIGRGVKLGSVTAQFNQGSFQSTSSVTDLAIDGDGFFLLSDNNGKFYTRAGEFNFDSEGNLANSNGGKVQGYMMESNGQISGTLSDINIASVSSSPTQSSKIDISANLDSRDSVPVAFSASDPAGTSNFSSSMTVYDSLGNPHAVRIYFRKDDSNSWEWHAMVDGGEITGGTSGVLEEQANGTIGFNSAGALDTETVTASSFNFTGGASQAQAIDFDFGTSITTDGGTGLDGTTQFGSTSATLFQKQDGSASGTLKSIGIDQDGVISGLFTNGTNKGLFRIAIANFKNPQGLSKSGKSMFSESKNSGLPNVGIPNTASFGKITSNSLEMSNVDLSSEFVRMITMQRGFQANSRIITTSDEILQELMNLKR